MSLDAHYFFFFNDTATTEIYTLSLHDALPIWHEPERTPRMTSGRGQEHGSRLDPFVDRYSARSRGMTADRKSTRLNSSHANISYAVFCLKKKKKNDNIVIILV